MNHPATRFVLIRHAHVDTGTPPGCLCGWLDLPLSAEGERQLVALRARTLVRERPAALYTSTLRRSLAVAAALSEIWSLPWHALDELREINCGELEGERIDVLTREQPALIARNHAQLDDDFTWPGGESYRQLRKRTLLTLSQIAAQHPAQRIVIVTHAGVIAQVIGVLKGRRPAEWQPDRPAPLSATEVTWANGAPHALLSFGSME